MQKIKKKWILILLCIIYLILGGIVIYQYALPHWTRTLNIEKYFDVFHDKATEFVLSETNAKELYGNDLRLRSNRRAYRYSDKYAGLSPKEQTPHSIEEFNQMIEKISIWVYVNRTEACVVVFEKKLDNEFLIVDWYWDDSE